ncbi:ABC transporter permease [Candidatus Sumerlaeota bacterium]|nr:ABC transporter permease [Candidatus Sumerlaeota bacterium]
MSAWRLILRGLQHYWRSQLAVSIGCALAAMTLTGSLLVGDSVRGSLDAQARERVGEWQLALFGRDRFFQAQRADELSGALGRKTAPALMLRGIVSNQDRTQRVNGVNVLGVDESFSPQAHGFRINAQLARRLHIGFKDITEPQALLRVENPSPVSGDSLAASVEDFSIAENVAIAGARSSAEGGAFSLNSGQGAPENLFAPLDWLQSKTHQAGRANLLLVEYQPDAPLSAEQANAALDQLFTLEDAALELRQLGDQLELRSSRIFIDPPLAQAAEQACPGATPYLTYFVNSLRANKRDTPYSMVSALPIGALKREAGLEELAPDEIVISQWLADDLQAAPGDALTLEYYVMADNRRLETQTRAFTVKAVLPADHRLADPELMPPFPGLDDAESCSDWAPGFPIDLDRIRDKDEDYWDAHRGAPKAWIALETGREIWGNRYGDVTALRWDAGAAPLDELRGKIDSAIHPAMVGLQFFDFRESALAASAESMDFGGLFISLGFFLIAAALILAGLLFSFAVRRRSPEFGLLMALGFSGKRAARLMLLEGLGGAVFGALIGVGLGAAYCRIIIAALNGAWSGAVGQTPLAYHGASASLGIGFIASLLAGTLPLWLVTRNLSRRPAKQLMQLGSQSESIGAHTGKRKRWPLLLAVVLLVIAVASSAISPGSGAEAGAYFFLAGVCVLAALLIFMHRLILATPHAMNDPRPSLMRLGVGSASRRAGRSAASAGILACGVFLVFAVGANRQSALTDADDPASGTGGFALYGESALPVYHDLNSAEGRDFFGLNAKALEGARVIALRLHEGDDASCLNLNRAQQPRLLGVDPAALKGRFTFAQTLDGAPMDWDALNFDAGPQTVAAVGDANSVKWILGQKLGGRLRYVDSRGQEFDVVIVGLLSKSLLQGSLLIAESKFTQRFQNSAGYKMFLIDTPSNHAGAVAKELTRALSDKGMELRPAYERLAEIQSVENTYLAIFLAFGWLALLLGGVGFGVVALRNLEEREGELALMRAVGFSCGQLRLMALSEYGALLALGVICGAIAAALSVWPAISAPGAHVEIAPLLMQAASIFFIGIVAILFAVELALRRPLQNALRRE